jgi:hypothetical protein
MVVDRRDRSAPAEGLASNDVLKERRSRFSSGDAETIAQNPDDSHIHRCATLRWSASYRLAAKT